METQSTGSWHELMRRHMAFWQSAEIDRPLIAVTLDAYQDTRLVAQAIGPGELTPQRVDSALLLDAYDRMTAVHKAIGDDMIVSAEPLLGIPWLEAICGCRVMVPDGISLWPEATEATRQAEQITFTEDNPWYRRLLDVQRAVVAHAAGRYPVSLTALRGPTDVLVAMLGSQQFLTALYDQPERITRLAQQAAQTWLHVARGQEDVVPAYRDGYVIRQFGVWSPGRSAWLQDDTSGMISLRHYRCFFLGPMQAMSVFSYGVLHLHAPSLHLAETLATVSNIRAINVYVDSQTMTLADTLLMLRRLQAARMPLVLAKGVREGFSLAEYEQIMDSLSPRGLSVHLRADSVAEGQEVMAYVRKLARRVG